MDKRLEQLGNFIFAYPTSYDDYVPLGRWLIYKRLLVLLALALILAAVLFPWLLRERNADIPVYYEFDETLKEYSGPVVLVNEKGETVFRGRVAEGLCTGRGRRLLPPDEALLYEGNFEQGRYHGQGTLYFGGLPRYVGDFRAGQFGGEGTLYEGERPVYIGQFARGLPNGQGSQYEDGVKRYTGGFLDGERDGEGAEYDPEGRVIYTGGFARGQREGQGVETTPDGAMLYEGSFRNGRYDGPGRLYGAGGTKLRFDGEFVLGRPGRTGSVYNAEGQLLYAGAVVDGQPDLLALLGLPLADLQQRVKELPTIFYDERTVGYLYPELGFAALTRYNFVDSRAGGAGIGDDELVGLFARPSDDLVAGELLIGGELLANRLPDGQPAPEPGELSGFEAFLSARLARSRRPNAPAEPEGTLIQRGEHLYEVSDLPERLAWEAVSLFDRAAAFFYDARELDKGGTPEVVICRKLKPAM